MTPPAPPPVTTDKLAGKGLGVAALVYCIAAVGYEIATFIAAGNAGGMDYGQIEALLPGLPVVIVIGIVFCLVAGALAPRGRKFAVIGGALLLAGPIVAYIIGAVVGQLS